MLQGTEARHVKNVVFRNIEVGECKNGVSFEHADNVLMSDCFIGGQAGVPTQIKYPPTHKKDIAFRRCLFWVPGGTRTHDIQNHNLTL